MRGDGFVLLMSALLVLPVAAVHAPAATPVTAAPEAAEPARGTVSVASAERTYGVLQPLVRFVKGLQANADDGRDRAQGEPSPTEPRASRRRRGTLHGLVLGLLQALLDLVRALGSFALLRIRIERKEVAEHPTRKSVLDVLRDRPGLHVESLARTLGANRKTLMHHLRKLHGAGRVALERDGKFVRVFTLPRPAAPLPPLLGDSRARVLEVRIANPAWSRGDIARHLGLTPQAVGYHLRALEGGGKKTWRHD